METGTIGTFKVSQKKMTLPASQKFWKTYYQIKDKIPSVNFSALVKSKKQFKTKETMESPHSQTTNQLSKKTELDSTNEAEGSIDVLVHPSIPGTETNSKQIKFMSFLEAKEKLTEINKALGKKKATDNDTKYALSKLNQRGMMVWFMNSGKLENIVFNDLKGFLELLKTIFSHEIANITYHELESGLQSIFRNKEKIFDIAMNSLLQNGLMSSQMIQLLLQQKRCNISVEAIIELLEKIDVGFRHKNNYVFIPFFVENKALPQDIKLEIENLAIVTATNIGLQTKIVGNIPVIFFSYFVVKLYRKLDPLDPTQSVVLWKNGMRATAGDAVVLADYDGTSCISLSVTGPPDELPFMWHVLSESVHIVEDLRCTWWPGNTQYTVINRSIIT